MKSKKSVLTINENQQLTKTLPDFFSKVYEITNEDLQFLNQPENELFLGIKNKMV